MLLVWARISHNARELFWRCRQSITHPSWHSRLHREGSARGALSAASNTAGAAAKSAETPTASGNNDRASVFIVEVVGYGGGENGGQDSNSSSGNGQGTKSDDQERKQP